MNFLRQLVSYVLLAGIAIPTFSMGMNPVNVVKNTFAGMQNAINDNVDMQFKLGLKPSHINEEVHAIKRAHVDRLNNLVHQATVTELRRDNAEFAALAARVDQIRVEIQNINNNLALPGITNVRRNQLQAELVNLGVESDEKTLLIDLYLRMYHVYGFQPLDVNGRAAVHAGPFAINTAIINDMRAAINIPANELIFFSTGRSQPHHREYGIAKGFIYPVHSGLYRKIVLINVNEFNRLNPIQRQDRIAHVLAQFKEQEAQWRILQKENRDRLISLAKKLPYIIAACGLVYYWAHGRTEVLPYTTLTDVYAGAAQACGYVANTGSWAYNSVATAGNALWSYMPSWGTQVSQVVAPVSQVVAPVTVPSDIGYVRAIAQSIGNGSLKVADASDSFCDAVIGLLIKMNIVAAPVVAPVVVAPAAAPVVAPVVAAPALSYTYLKQLRDLIKFVYADLVARTPYEIKTIGSAVAGSWMADTILSGWNKLYNIIDSYRADKIVCQARGEAGLAGVYERSAHDVAQNRGGMTRMCYLWLQKKLGRI